MNSSAHLPRLSLYPAVMPIYSFVSVAEGVEFAAPLLASLPLVFTVDLPFAGLRVFIALFSIQLMFNSF